MIKSFFILVALITALPATAREARSVNARVVYFQDSKENPVELFYASDSGDFAKMTPNGGVGGNSVKMLVSASGQVALLKTAAAGSAVAIAHVPDGVTEAVFFLLQTPASKSTGVSYQVLVVDESIKNMPPGGGFICNIGSSATRASMGEAKYVLPPGKTAYFKRPEKRDDYNMASFQIESQENDVWKPVKDTLIRFSENERYFFIIYAETSRVTSVRIYKQFMPVERRDPGRNATGS